MRNSQLTKAHTLPSHTILHTSHNFAKSVLLSIHDSIRKEKLANPCL